jgi:hypothetical protein
MPFVEELTSSFRQTDMLKGQEAAKEEMNEQFPGCSVTGGPSHPSPSTFSRTSTEKMRLLDHNIKRSFHIRRGNIMLIFWMDSSS